MIKTNRILALVLALAALAALLAGCGVDPADRCVKNDGGAVSIPALKLNFAFDDFWFPVTEEEFNAIGENIDLIYDYIDPDTGEILKEYPAPSSGTELLLLNLNTLETCHILVSEDTREYSMDNFAASMFDEMQDDMFEISLPESVKVGKHTAYTIFTVPFEAMTEEELAEGEIHGHTTRYRYYFLHENDTYVQIVLTGFADTLGGEAIVEA
ncbi:MAG: hypothetical protein IKK98_07725 [Oscillospiraceae bacterium]|nr:hypothetical protein [Oscillospiraceae bacterium]MBQ2791981.1 hypothetical protein [Oscillospiraceae bacterium]MBQ3242651.1 hypothetical protein [Oscillospiraceae bacterium]MBQ7081978.1 hypothetical protein [Oscillospiraceae bacterium]MBR6608527.1 hypothetical protein [Oscillospiraceae bacterium]